MSSQARDNSNPVTANLIAEMDRLDLTATRTAELLSVSRRQVSRWRNGQEPRYEFVLRMADAFDREPQWFYVERELERAA